MPVRIAGFLIIISCSLPVLAKPAPDCFDKQEACNQNCIAKLDAQCIDQCTSAVQSCLDTADEARNVEDEHNVKYVYNYDDVPAEIKASYENSSKQAEDTGNKEILLVQAPASEASLNDPAVRMNLYSAGGALQVAEAPRLPAVVESLFYVLLMKLLR